MALKASYYKIPSKKNPIANALNKNKSTVGLAQQIQNNIANSKNVFTQNKSYYRPPVTNKNNSSYYDISKNNITPVDKNYGTGLLEGSSYSGGGGSSAPVQEDYAIDLSDILKTYSESAAAQQQTIRDTTAASIKALENSEASQRAQLTKALERFQEDNAKERQQQQAAFNSNRADLEAQAYLANRQALQSAAARGLGGSGLQQLAQLQNLINQSTATNELATSNTDALNALAQSLSRQEEDTTTSLNDLANNLATQIQALNTAQADKINEIEKNTGSLKSQLQYQEAVRAQDARRQAEQFAANLAAQNASTASNWALYNQQKQVEYNNLADQTTSSLAALITDAANQMKSASKSSTNKKDSEALAENNAAVQAAYDAAVSNLANIYGASGLDKSIYLDPYSKQLANLYSKYYVTK